MSTHDVNFIFSESNILLSDTLPTPRRPCLLLNDDDPCRAVRFWDFKVGFGFGSVSGKNRGFGFGFGFP